MFEHHQQEMQQLLKDNENFRRLYNRHQKLDRQVTAAEQGIAPLDDLALNKLKKQKLRTKDQLSRLMQTAAA